VLSDLNWQETRSITSKHSMDTLANTKLSDKHSHKGNYFNNPQYRPCYSRWLRKILLFYKKNVDSLKTCVIYLKVYEVDFWWQIVEIYIICSIAIVEMVIFRSRLKTVSLSASKSVDESEPTIASSCKPTIGLVSIEASACCAEDSGALALSSCLGCLVAGRFFEFSHLMESHFYSPTSVWIICEGVFNSSNWRERRCKFRSDWRQIRCVFNKYLRKYYCEAKKILLTSM
jgi:hypothetical protein